MPVCFPAASPDRGCLNATVQQKLRVVVIAPNLGSDLGWLSDLDPRIEVLDGNALAQDIDGGKPLLERAEVILLGYPVPRGIVERAPHLRWVQHTQAGVSNLHGTDLWDSPVTLTSSRGAVAATGIAEYVIAGAYYFASGLNEAARQKAAGEFSRRGYALRTLTGATIGIVGLGGIGAEVARLARAAGMRVVATRRSVASPKRDTEGVDLLLPAGQVAELAAASDFVAVCVQLTPATEKMIGAEVLAAMKPHSVLINIARGEVIDEDALVAALQAGRIAGAVLDVYAGELAGRPPRRELVELPQVVLTPHISGLGDPGGNEPVKRLFAENLRRYLKGQSLLNLVDRSRGY
jgi:phosphoglycerate dehydrogenase-like enzyme